MSEFSGSFGDLTSIFIRQILLAILMSGCWFHLLIEFDLFKN